MSNKKPPDIKLELINKDKPEFKCFNIFSYNKLSNNIFYELMKISKNVYNSTLYSYNIFYLYQNKVYKYVYEEYIKNKNIDCEIFFKNKMTEYYNDHSKLYEHIKQNNNYIYNFIKNYITINEIIINNDNCIKTINFFKYILSFDNNIFQDMKNNDILFYDIVKKIVYSFYVKNYNLIKNQMLEHKPYSFKDDSLINACKNNTFLDLYPKNIYKNKLKNEFSIELSSHQNLIGRLTYSKLGENSIKLDTTMIGSIMSKACKAYSSYYALLKKGIKANKPKYIDKNGIYNLIYSFSKVVKIDIEHIKLFTSNYMSKNFEKIFGEDYIKLANYKYIHKKYLLNKTGKKILKKNNYIINDKYINKDNKNIINSKYVIIKIPSKLLNSDITSIEIVNKNTYTKICFVYRPKYTINNINNTATINESISIDLGMKNLLTIYDPTGKQHIIDGKFITSINKHYNKLIEKAQGNNNMMLFYKYTQKRKHIINNYFNLIVKWMNKVYNHKKLVIVGYNKEWKNNTNIGRENNKKFNKIPYIALLKKLENKLIENDKHMILTEESYTSKCDSLALEELCKHDKYLGKRCKRGLFSSSKGKLINADLNGAINIMRKQFTMINKIKGIRLQNVERINIFREV
jgi:putative transposase